MSFNYQLVDKLNTNNEMDEVVNDIIMVRRHYLHSNIFLSALLMLLLTLLYVCLIS